MEKESKVDEKKEIQSMGKFADSETSPSKRNEYEKNILQHNHFKSLSHKKFRLRFYEKKASFPTYEHSSFILGNLLF